MGASDDDPEYSALVVGHEVGHNHGLPHSPGCDAGDPDPAYPYDGGFLGSWGYDHRHEAELLDPTKTYDIMTYCEPVWFSDYTYKQVAQRVAQVNGQQLLRRQGALPQASWQVLIASPNAAARWGHPYVGRAPSRAPEAALVLDTAGNPLASVNVFRVATSARHATSFIVPSPASDWAAIQIQGLPPVPFETR